MKITDQILSAWIDDSLSPAKMKAVSAAVDADSALQARAEALRAVGAALRQERVVVPVTAERLLFDIRREIRREKSPIRSGFSRWVWAGAAVCACLAIAALWFPSGRGAGAQVVQTEVESVDSELSGVSTMVYTDDVAGWTVVWLDGVELESGS
jgi:anti-sigma factor RsiW